MARLPLYPIPPDAYLFKTPRTDPAKRTQLEEPVRQWSAFELMRAYGFNISDLRFEYPVKIGSKPKWIDILVLRRNRPWIVVECKEPSFAKHQVGLDQAISYANNEAIRAEFVIYTNGHTWKVQRRIQEEWSDILDIPNADSPDAENSLDDLLITIEELTPLLHKIDDPMHGEEARVFLSVMRRFFHGTNLLTRNLSRKLLFATDNLLRVLSGGLDDDHYARQKLGGAGQCFEEYRRDTGVGYELPHIGEGEHVCQYMQILMASMSSMLDRKHASPVGVHGRLIQLNLALLEYGRQQFSPLARYPAITASLHETLRGFLSYILAVEMNLRLPTSLDQSLTSDMKHFCRKAWDDALVEHQQ
jgi:hypothetical protein